MLERQFSFGPHGTVQTVMLCSLFTVFCSTVLSSTHLRDTLLWLCTHLVPVLCRLLSLLLEGWENKQYAGKPQCAFLLIFKSPMFCLDERITSVCAAYSSIVSEKKGAVLNANPYKYQKPVSPLVEMQWAGTQRLVIFHSPLIWWITTSFSSVHIYELLFDSPI